MASQISYYVSRAEIVVTELLDIIVPQEYIEPVTDYVVGVFKEFVTWLSSSVPRIMSFAWQLGSGVVSVFVAVIVSVYMLLAKELFIAQARKILCAFLPKKTVHKLVSVSRTTHYMFGRFISGKIIDSTIIGILCFIGLSVMKMPNTVLVSFIVGVTNVIPYFGPFFGAIPSFFIISIVSPAQGVIFLVFILVLQQIDGNVIGPKILGDSTGLSAFWVLFSLLFFGNLFGVTGMVIGVPTFGVIYRLVKDAITNRLNRKGLSSDTTDYLKPLVEDDDLPGG